MKYIDKIPAKNLEKCELIKKINRRMERLEIEDKRAGDLTIKELEVLLEHRKTIVKGRKFLEKSPYKEKLFDILNNAVQFSRDKNLSFISKCGINEYYWDLGISDLVHFFDNLKKCDIDFGINVRLVMRYLFDYTDEQLKQAHKFSNYIKYDSRNSKIIDSFFETYKNKSY